MTSVTLPQPRSTNREDWMTIRQQRTSDALSQAHDDGLTSFEVISREGKVLTLADGSCCVEFISCSYLGLEAHPALRIPPSRSRTALVWPSPLRLATPLSSPTIKTRMAISSRRSTPTRLSVTPQIRLRSIAAMSTTIARFPRLLGKMGTALSIVQFSMQMPTTTS